MSKSDDQEVTLFLTAYAPGDALATKLSLEIAQNGRTLAPNSPTICDQRIKRGAFNTPAQFHSKSFNLATTN